MERLREDAKGSDRKERWGKRYRKERQKNKDIEGKENWRERGYRQREEAEEYGQRERDTGRDRDEIERRD